MIKTLLRFAVQLYLLNLRLQMAATVWTLARSNVGNTLAEDQNEAPRGLQFERERETDTYTVRHVIEDGIERVTVTPRVRLHETPILFQHGMWAGAWAWEDWQILFAEWGWESHAYSLPGHGWSNKQRPLWRCTLDYYLAFLKTEVERLPVKPIIIGHSMGGALSQWYLKHVDSDLPAVVMLASMPAHSALTGTLPLALKTDPFGVFLSTLTWNTSPQVRNPYQTGRKCMSPGATMKPVDLHAKFSDDSMMVIFQHNPPFWSPPQDVKAPVLWIAPENDLLVAYDSQKRSAAFYNADFVSLPGAAHNLMTEPDNEQIAERVHNWLTERGIN